MKRKKSRRNVSSLAEWKGLHMVGRRPKIETDPEVRAFVDDALTRMTFQEVADAAREQFGAGRAPGLSVIHRYWHAQQK
jgi:hypothetical protein